MTLLINQGGVVNVGLTDDYGQHKRAVAPLVASAFLPKIPRQRDAFDTPINLDGDRSNNDVNNLMWRPRWFAVKYFQQFNSEPKGYRVPIEDIKTGERFETSWEAATTYGLLDIDIVVAMERNTWVFPTYQKFRIVD